MKQYSVFIVGSSSLCEENFFAEECNKLGMLLAAKQWTLLTGGGNGIPDLVAKSYVKNGGNFFKVILPSEEEQMRANELQGVTPSEIIKTKLSYPERNVKLVNECDMVVVINGGLGALTEIIHAVKDFKKEVFMLSKGKLYEWIMTIEDLRSCIHFRDNIEGMASELSNFAFNKLKG